MAFENVQGQENGFSTITGVFTAAPIFASFRCEGLDKAGIVWDDVEVAAIDVGADGLSTTNTKPVVRSATMTFKPNSSTRKYLDRIIALSSVSFGVQPTDYELTSMEVNRMLGTKTSDSGGKVTTAAGGNSATLDDGQQSKKYVFKFSGVPVTLPL